jgi:hypothetical protein
MFVITGLKPFTKEFGRCPLYPYSIVPVKTSNVMYLPTNKRIITNKQKKKKKKKICALT